MSEAALMLRIDVLIQADLYTKFFLNPLGDIASGGQRLVALLGQVGCSDPDLERVLTAVFISGLMVEDARFLNGTLVNDSKVHKTVLGVGYRVLVC